MKRYWIFLFKNYYPFGGMEDFCISFDLLKQAELFCENIQTDEECRGHILDTKDFKIIKEFTRLFDYKKELNSIIFEWNEEVSFEFENRKINLI